jgi:hypothetical protein
MKRKRVKQVEMKRKRVKARSSCLIFYNGKRKFYKKDGDSSGDGIRC